MAKLLILQITIKKIRDMTAFTLDIQMLKQRWSKPTKDER